MTAIWLRPQTAQINLFVHNILQYHVDSRSVLSYH